MTKLREPGSRFEALSQALTLLGSEAACAATGLSYAHLKHCSDSDDGREVTLKAVEALCQASARAGLDAPLLAFLERVVRDAKPMCKAEGRDPHATLLDCVQAVGNLSGTFRAAIADGALCQRERIALWAQAVALRQQVDDLWAALHEDPVDQEIAALRQTAELACDGKRETERALRREEMRRVRLQQKVADIESRKGAR